MTNSLPEWYIITIDQPKNRQDFLNPHHILTSRDVSNDVINTSTFREILYELEGLSYALEDPKKKDSLYHDLATALAKMPLYHECFARKVAILENIQPALPPPTHSHPDTLDIRLMIEAYDTLVCNFRTLGACLHTTLENGNESEVRDICLNIEGLCGVADIFSGDQTSVSVTILDTSRQIAYVLD